MISVSKKLILKWSSSIGKVTNIIFQQFFFTDQLFIYNNIISFV